MNTFIYALIDLDLNQFIYIGKSDNPQTRFTKHKKREKLQGHPNLELYILDIVSIEDWEFWEIFYIGYYKSIGCSLYNIHKGGKLDFKHSKKYKNQFKINTEKLKNDFLILYKTIDIPIGLIGKECKIGVNSFCKLLQNNYELNFNKASNFINGVNKLYNTTLKIEDYRKTYIKNK